MPSSPKVKKVTKDNGFIPVRYAFLYGMYIVPHRMPAPIAASTPRQACPAGACVDDAHASITAPTNITSAPPMTPIQRRAPAPRSSLNSRNPQKIPNRLFEFQSGNAMLRPMSRIAKIVSVFATAHMHPATMAQITRCGACRTSSSTYDVPWISVGTVQRARKTPTTIPSDTTIGEIPAATSLDRKSTRLNSSHANISYAVFCLKKKNKKNYRHKLNSQGTQR